MPNTHGTHSNWNILWYLYGDIWHPNSPDCKNKLSEWLAKLNLLLILILYLNISKLSKLKTCIIYKFTNYTAKLFIKMYLNTSNIYISKRLIIFTRTIQETVYTFFLPNMRMAQTKTSTSLKISAILNNTDFSYIQKYPTECNILNCYICSNLWN